MSTAPTEEDIKLAKETADVLSSFIQMGFWVNQAIPPMPPYPAIPKKDLTELMERGDKLMHQAIMVAKKFKKHADKKGIEAGPLIYGLASIDIPEVRIHFE